MIRTAAVFGVPCWRKLGYPGTWTAGGKLGAVGVAVRRWVTLHGAALNVSPDLAHFSLIVPCGLNDAKATSLERTLGRPIDGELAREVLRDCCADVLGLDLVDAHGTDFKATVTPHGLTCPAAPLTAASRGTG
jgi:lipoate-protein ligase B